MDNLLLLAFHTNALSLQNSLVTNVNKVFLKYKKSVPKNLFGVLKDIFRVLITITVFNIKKCLLGTYLMQRE